MNSSVLLMSNKTLDIDKFQASTQVLSVLRVLNREGVTPLG